MHQFNKTVNLIDTSTIEVKSQIITEERKQQSLNNNKLDWSDFTILIAEDEEHSFIYMHTILEVTGIKILRAKNGRECVELVRKEPSVDLILMDVQMPVMNGMEATKAIKSFRKDITIITQTAFALKENKENCKAVGSDDFLTKPIRVATLLKTLGKYLDSSTE